MLLPLPFLPGIDSLGASGDGGLTESLSEFRRDKLSGRIGLATLALRGLKRGDINKGLAKVGNIE